MKRPLTKLKKYVGRALCLPLLALVMLHASVITSWAQTQLSAYVPGVTPDGAVYFLPKTALRISVLVEKTTYEPGDLAPYAQRYLRISDVSQERATRFRVAGISVTPCPVADTTKAYAVHFDPRTVAARLTLSQDGRLLALNMEDVEDMETPAPYVPAPQPEWVNPKQFLGEDILSCGSTAKMAEMTAHEIYDLRENRSLLIKGQADFMPQDGRQMELMLNELDRQDRALTSLFTGTTQCDTTEHVLWVVPERTDSTAAARRVLFRLSQVKGLVEADDLSGAPYYVTIDNISQLPEEQPATKGKKGKSVAGIFVNVPGRLRITLYQGITPILTEEHPAPQYGQTMLLGADLLNKRYNTRVLLDNLSGALLRLDADQPK